MPILDRLSKRAWPVWVEPGKLAALFAVVYMVFFGAYIVVSGFIAGKLAETINELQGIEIAKGLLFILLTGTLFFMVNYGLLTRLHRQTRKLLEQEHAIIMVERRALGALRASTIAHDLNNVLMCLTGLMAELKKREGGDELSRIMREGVEKGIDSVTQMSKRMVALSRPESQSQRALLDMRVALSSLVKLSQSHPDVRSCKVAVAEVPAVRLDLIQPLLDVAVMNLLINAAQATGRGGRIELRLREEGVHWSLEVHDNGPGISPEAKEHVFDACYTTKPEGTGLGLFTVKSFAESCGGRVEVGTSPLGGALFKVLIPRGKEVPVAAQATAV